MTDRRLLMAREKALTIVTECEQRLWRAQEGVRSADVMLRRAVRAAEQAEGELGEAARRRDRMPLESPRAGQGAA